MIDGVRIRKILQSIHFTEAISLSALLKKLDCDRQEKNKQNPAANDFHQIR